MVRVSRKHKKGSHRRTHKRQNQQGGEYIDSIDEWIKAVLKTKPFRPQGEDMYTKQPNEENEVLRLGKYNIGDLINDGLKLPVKEKDQNGLFVTDTINTKFQLFDNDPNDFRDIAISLRYSFSDIINNTELTPYEFLMHVKDAYEDPNIDSTVMQALDFASAVETRLQQKARNDPTLEPIDILTNEQYYPLFILTLIVNTEGEEVPILLSEAALEVKLSQSASEYGQQRRRTPGPQQQQQDQQQQEQQQQEQPTPYQPVE